MLRLERRVDDNGVAAVGSFGGLVTFGFTERAGGVSAEPYASLNLGSHVGDDPAAVWENRCRALALFGAEDLADRLIVPNQVHGDNVVTIDDASFESLSSARNEALAGADAIVCTVPGIPVLLCFADCVPVILVCPGGFAVVHSGWKGTYTRIAAKAARVLADAARVSIEHVEVYIGPHIQEDEYEVSSELIERFLASFGDVSPCGPRLLSLSRAIRQALVEDGVPNASIVDLGLSTVRMNDRFFSYRAEHGVCGRHAAVAVMR